MIFRCQQFKQAVPLTSHHEPVFKLVRLQISIGRAKNAKFQIPNYSIIMQHIHVHAEIIDSNKFKSTLNLAKKNFAPKILLDNRFKPKKYINNKCMYKIFAFDSLFAPTRDC